jgi:hypothetical protein
MKVYDKTLHVDLHMYIAPSPFSVKFNNGCSNISNIAGTNLQFIFMNREDGIAQSVKLLATVEWPRFDSV